MRTGSEPSATACGSASTIGRNRRVGPAAFAARSASCPTNGSGLSSATAKPSPASYGVSAGVTSAPQTR